MVEGGPRRKALLCPLLACKGSVLRHWELTQPRVCCASAQAVLAGASASREGTLCCQAVFGLLDTLQKWLADAKAVVQQQLASYQADKGAAGGRGGAAAGCGCDWCSLEGCSSGGPAQPCGRGPAAAASTLACKPPAPPGLRRSGLAKLPIAHARIY